MKTLIYPLKNSIDNFSLDLYIDNISKNNSKDEIIKVFQELINRDYSFNTKDALFRDIKTFIKWYETKNGENIELKRIIEKDIIDFKNDLKKDGMSVSTINRKLVSLRLFFNMAIDLGYLDKNIGLKVRQFKNVGLSPKSLNQFETRKFLKEVELRGNLRDKTIIYLMLYSGLRVGEVVKLEIGDININERSGFIIVKNGKGGKTRKVPLSLSLREILSQYLKELLEKSSDSSDSSKKIFVSQRGVLSEIGVNKILDKYSSFCNIKVTPHILRHTFAYSYLKTNNSDIVGLSQILGHSSIETTSIYTQNRLEDLQERVEKM